MKEVTYTKLVNGTYKVELFGKFIGTVEKNENAWVVVGVNGLEFGISGKTRKSAMEQYLGMINIEAIREHLDGTEVAFEDDVKVNIGSYYKMKDGRVAYTGFHGQLVLMYTDGTSEAYDSELMQVELMQGKVQEADKVIVDYSKTKFKKGVSKITGDNIRIVGEKIVKLDGVWVTYYIFNIEGEKEYFTEDQDNVVVIGY
jgi:hypothetical protein